MGARIHPRLAWQIVDGEAIVVDPAAGTAIGLNPVGAFIWSLLDTHSDDAIAEEVSARFEVDPETAKVDLLDFVRALRERELITD